jgi:chromosome segregation ATPase
MLQWIAKRHANVSRTYQLEKDAQLLTLRTIEKDLEMRNVQGLIAMAREDIQQDGLEVSQAETDVKNLEASLPELQAADTDARSLAELQAAFDVLANYEDVAGVALHEATALALTAKQNVQSVHDEIAAARQRIEMYQGETPKRQAEIDGLTADLTKLRAIKAECQAQAQRLRTIAAELRQRA